MSFYHWFSSHPNEIDLSGDIRKMQDIAKELRITDAKKEERPKQTDFRRISSVPDIWSQHRLFEMLLLNKAEDPSYLEYEAIAKREWRAIVAILVLAESYGIRIQTETIRFSAHVSNPYLRAAYNTRPNQAQWPSMDVYYVEQEGERFPIAMSSPTVHVIPTKDAWRNLRIVCEGKIPWLTEKQVFAPVVDDNGFATPFMLGEKEAEKVPAMMPVHALLLQRWLANYRETLIAKQKREGTLQQAQNILLIASYEQALSDAFRLRTDRMPDMSSFFATEQRQVATRLNDVRMPKNLKIFLERAFYSTIDKSSSRQEILDTHRFAGGIAKECLVSKQQKDGTFVHFFVAMPVTEEFWKLWRDNEALKPEYTLRCVFSSDDVYLDRITASIVIGDITFSRTYPTARIDSERWWNLCTAGIWPRQNIANWTNYYLFCNETGGYELEPEKETVLNEKFYEGKDDVEGSLHYYKLNRAPESCKLLINKKHRGYLMIRKRDTIFAGDTASVYRASIDFGTSATTLYGGVDDSTPEKISGMNLWSLPLINSTDSAGSEKAALERFFIPPIPMPMYQSSVRVNKAEPVNTSYEELLRNPAEVKSFSELIPMQTILGDTRESNEPREVFQDSWITFRGLMPERTASSWPKIHSNLKWNQSGQADQYRIQAILTEIFMLIVLEARVKRCGAVSITASYPTSFDKTTRKKFYQALNEMLEVTARLTGLKVLPPPPGDTTNPSENARNTQLVGSITESEAVYRFSIIRDSYNQNYFVLDIGGGSIDIFLSLMDDNNRRNSFATSLGFGARTILIDKLIHEDNLLLRKLFTASAIGNANIVRDINRYVVSFTKLTKHSMVEDIFSLKTNRNHDNPAAALLPMTYGEIFSTICANSEVNPAIAKENPQEYKDAISFQELKKRIAYFLGASVWLSGRMIRDGENSGMNVSLLFAGNGSKMVQWLSPDIERIRHFVTLMFQRASGAPISRDQMNCRFSAKPKEEVAFGALADFPTGFLASSGDATKQVSFGQASQLDNDLVSFHPMQYETMDIPTDLDEFADFMNTYRIMAKSSFGWDFFENEYDINILSHGGVNAAINGHLPNNGYFLNAVDIVAAWNLGNDHSNLTY